MARQLLDGKAISQSLRADIAAAAEAATRAGSQPGLATVLVGEHPASLSYVRGKQKACATAGIFAEDVRLPADTSEDDLLGAIGELNGRDDIHGILVQQPLPSHLDETRVVAAIDPGKDVDGFHPVNLGRLMRGEPGFVPCTPFGIVKMLATAGVDTSGANVVIVGRSLLVGKPLASLLMQKSSTGNATVTVCHSRTRELATVTSGADILVAAMGQPAFITAQMVRDGAVVVDVGINRVDDASRKRGYRLVGDVDFDAVSEKASLITPVPGGVGPLTVTMLLYNTVQAARGLSSLDDLVT
ncbi:MAG: bifunctional methylenetetrahydrofolate dehydrogenase/methenyltetrahydrofolate cyclohydrolase FolD [Spirochaetota bacterium]